MNAIDDFKQYMDVTYVMQIGWTDHRITSIGVSIDLKKPRMNAMCLSIKFSFSAK